MVKLKVENGYVGEDVSFERIRRITGYLVGTLDRFNSGKRAEVEDRVVHCKGNVVETENTINKAA